MSTKEVKVGETYNVRVKVIGITDNYVDVLFVDAAGIEGLHIGKQKIGILRSINPYEPLKLNVTRRIPETYPKQDPNRKFRKGDKVRLKAYNGRKPYDFWHKQTIEHFGAKLDTVLEDELDSGNVDIFQDAPIDELTVRVHASHLELVTPVEELEPYEVECDGDEKEYSVTYRNKFVCTYPYDADSFYTKEQAQAAAEAERDRLNVEWRKERENG